MSTVESYFLPELIDLQHTENGNGVHEGCVELEVGVVWTDVIGARHEALHDQCEPHGIEETWVIWYSIFPVDIRVLRHQLLVQQLSPPDEHHEEAPQHHVANVGEDVVEIGECPKGMSTQEVVVAEILIACRSKNLILHPPIHIQRIYLILLHLFDSKLFGT